MKVGLVVFMFLFSWVAQSQSSYSGYLGELPITLVMYHYSDGESKAYYAYDKYDNPIKINGTLRNGTLELLERNKSKNIIASLIFKDFKENNKQIKGVWANANNTKTLQILLTKDFEINSAKKKCNNEELLKS